MIETHVSLPILLYLDVFWASSCLQSTATPAVAGVIFRPFRAQWPAWGELN